MDGSGQHTDDPHFTSVLSSLCGSPDLFNQIVLCLSPTDALKLRQLSKCFSLYPLLHDLVSVEVPDDAELLRTAKVIRTNSIFFAYIVGLIRMDEWTNLAGTMITLLGNTKDPIYITELTNIQLTRFSRNMRIKLLALANIGISTREGQCKLVYYLLNPCAPPIMDRDLFRMKRFIYWTNNLHVVGNPNDRIGQIDQIIHCFSHGYIDIFSWDFRGYTCFANNDESHYNSVSDAIDRFYTPKLRKLVLSYAVLEHCERGEGHLDVIHRIVSACYGADGDPVEIMYVTAVYHSLVRGIPDDVFRVDFGDACDRLKETLEVILKMTKTSPVYNANIHVIEPLC